MKKKAKTLPQCKTCNEYHARQSDYCSDKCENEALRAALAEERERVARLSRKKGEIKVLAQVKWNTCVQEWYPRDTYDAKRRAHQLRALGYTVNAKHLGEMPISNGSGIKMVHVTLLTAWHSKKNVELPAAESLEGLEFEGVGEVA